MAELTRTGSAQWNGDLKTGSGNTSTGSGGVHDLSYSVSSRFESGKGTNPEELIAAAHASCFSMMLAKLLGDAGAKPKRISTRATLTMRVDNAGPKITKVHLVTEVAADGVPQAKIEEAATQAKDKCPVSQLLKPGLESLTFEAKVTG